MFDRIQHVYPVFKNQGRVFLYMMYEEGERDMLIKINLIIILYYIIYLKSVVSLR